MIPNLTIPTWIVRLLSKIAIAQPPETEKSKAAPKMIGDIWKFLSVFIDS